MNRPSYSPSGVCKDPIPVRLMEDELIEAQAIASEAGVSRSKVLREAIVAGLPSARRNLVGSSETVLPLSSTAAAGNPPTAADFSGGEASASPAGLSSTLAA